jgi:hypothetical protein
MSILIPASKEHLKHLATAIMTGIHDEFPTNMTDSDDQILEKKLLKGEGRYSLLKMLLGYDFDEKKKM